MEFSFSFGEYQKYLWLEKRGRRCKKCRRWRKCRRKRWQTSPK